MTTSRERTNALKNVRDFLRRMLSAKQEDGIKRIPKEVRRECYYLLKHYPHDFEIDQITECKKCGKILGKDER